MTRSQKIMELYTRYADNYDRFSQLNDALLVDCDAKEWQELLINRSITQRDIIVENESIINQVKKLLEEPIVDKAEADELLLFYRPLANLRFVDYTMLELLYDSLSDFYTKTNDYLPLIGLNVTAGGVVATLYLPKDSKISSIEPLDCFLRAIEYSKKVSPLKNPSMWISVFSAYANILSAIHIIYPEVSKDFFRYYDEALSYFEDPEIGPVLMAEPNGPLFKSLIEGRFMYSSLSYSKMNDEEKKKYRDIIYKQRINPDIKLSDGERIFLKYSMGYIIGEIEPRTAYEAMYNYICEHIIQDTKDVNDRINTVNIMDSAFILDGMLGILADDIYDEKEKEEKAIEIADIIFRVIQSVPYGYMTGYVNSTCYELSQAMLPYINNFEALEIIINRLLILRQPITYMHSLMVREVSLLILDEILKNKPELLIPLFGDSTQDVLFNADRIIAFVSKSAILHDIGKTKVVDFINNQYRSLTEEEYEYIKIHAEMGPEIILNKECFKPYYDIMVGHHKSYDGKSGYPISFDNINSEYKIIIDLITISDCIDASTDFLGRNYAGDKRFSDVLMELVKGKGTLFNPEIVTMIENSQDLINNIALITGENRKQIYYKAYRDVMRL